MINFKGLLRKCFFITVSILMLGIVIGPYGNRVLAAKNVRVYCVIMTDQTGFERDYLNTAPGNALGNGRLFKSGPPQLG